VELTQELRQAEDIIAKIAAHVGDDTVEMDVNPEIMKLQDRMLSLQRVTDNKKEIVKNIIETMTKRSYMLQNRKLTPEEEIYYQGIKTKVQILHTLNNNADYDRAIAEFISQASTDVKDMIDKVPNIGTLTKDASNQQFANVAQFLTELKSYADAYEPLVDQLRAYMLSDAYKNQTEIDLNPQISQLTGVLKDARVWYNQAAFPIVKSFAVKYAGSFIGTTYKGKKVTEETIENILLEAEHDIGFMDR